MYQLNKKKCEIKWLWCLRTKNIGIANGIRNGLDVGGWYYSF